MNDTLIGLERFNEIELMRKHSWIEPYARGSHDMGSKSHETLHYKYPMGQGIYAHWSICPDCKTLRTKKLIGYIEQDEDGYATSLVHDIVKKGEKV